MLRKSIEIFIESLYGKMGFTYYRVLEMKKYGDYRFPYNKKLNGETVFVLANGPSLKDELAELMLREDFLCSHKFVLNFFSDTDAYMKVKPDFYCLADKGFFMENSSERYRRCIENIDGLTDWNLQLFVPNNYYHNIKGRVSNKKIDIIPISTLQFQGFEKYRYKSYKSGKAVPSFVNVVIMIEYILLNMGCKDIRLYGVDHTFFEGMTVNDDNIPCIVDKHFDKTEFRPLIKLDGGYFTTAGWLMDKYLTFKEHEIMRGYADYLGAQIINCTKCSLIDAYVRESQLNQKK